jgi:erythromycin esterase-like protein
MFSRGEYNLGHLCRKGFGDFAPYAIGFGTHTGTVAAASNWDGPMEIKTVLPAIPDSYEHVCHETGKQSFLLNLRRSSLNETSLRKPRYERAIGVITVRKQSSPATISRPFCRNSSTNTSGLTRRGRSRRLDEDAGGSARHLSVRALSGNRQGPWT